MACMVTMGFRVEATHFGDSWGEQGTKIKGVTAYPH